MSILNPTIEFRFRDLLRLSMQHYHFARAPSLLGLAFSNVFV